VTITRPTLSLRPSPSKSYGARLLGVGAAQPRESIDAADIGARYGRSAEWIEARTGIQRLRRVADGGRLIDLALDAARDAIAAAGTSAIDVVICATCSTRPGHHPLSPRLQAELAPGAATFDLNAACAGFSYAISTADALIRAGSARRVLVVGADQLSDLIDPDDLGTGIIFGDGAGAAVLGAGSDDQTFIGPVVWGSDGDQAAVISFPEGDPFMRMAGQQVFRWAVAEMPAVALAACAKAGVEPAEIEVFVPHQANLRIIDAIAKKIGVEHAIISADVVVSGNTSAASIPIAMTRLLASGAARSGQLALLIGFGAGLSYAAQVIRLP
jgi:3-oxoacyl-[acyl-carrier-protein] synthase-3